MPGSIWLKTLRDLRGQILAWSLGLAALGAANVLVFPSFQSMPGLVPFLEHLPPVVKAMMGDVQAVTRLEGFLRPKLFDPLPLLLAVFVVSQGARALAGEVEHRSVDLLMAQPIRRRRVVLEKYLAVAGAAVILCLALAASLVVCSLLIDSEVRADHLVLATLNALPLTWLFAGLAVLGSSLTSRARRASLLAGSIVVASYVFDTLQLLSPVLARWRALSLFAHYKASYSLAGDLSPAPILLLLGIAVILVAGAVATWERRDLLS